MDDAVLDKIEHAEHIVNSYGAILSRLEQVNPALPESLLPFDKTEIREAIQLLLWEIEGMDDNITNSLVQAYVYLEQFIPNNKVEIVNRGQAAIQSADPAHDDWQLAGEANKIINQIKIDMENAMNDLRLFLNSSI